MEEMLENPEDPEQAMTFTEDLATAVEGEDSMSEQDIYQSTKLIEAAARAKPNNASTAKHIIKVLLNNELRNITCNLELW